MSELTCPPQSEANCALHFSPDSLPGPQPPLHETWLSAGATTLAPDGCILLANDALAAWLSSSPAALKGRSLPKLLGQRCADWEEPLRQFMAQPAPFDRLQLSSRNGHGLHNLSLEICRHGPVSFLRLESLAPPSAELENLFPDAAWGKIAGHQLFQRMLRAEAQLENLLHCWPGIIFSQRADFSFIFVSPKIEALTGVSPAEWQRQSRYFWEIVHEGDAEPLAARLRSEPRTPKGITSTFRIRHIQTGQVTYLWEHRRALFTSNGLLLGYEGIWLDITRQTIAERRLLSMSWRENLGTLALGMAHDFCNMMTGIVGLSETFESGLKPEEPLWRGLGTIRNTALQAGQLAHRIRQLHQGEPGEKNYADLNGSVKATLEILQKVLPRRIRFRTSLAPGQLPLYVDAVELQQVLINLALNAADAMPQGGQLTFRTTRHEALPSPEHLQGALPKTPLLCLSVQDTGTGIPPQLLGSIFDPFFTTKPLGKGSGLGLYNARLFAEKHGAAISVETKEGAGTTFHLWFGQADFTEALQARPAARAERHTLLVVGPAGELRDHLIGLLRQNGYYAVPALGQAEGLEALLAPHFSFSAVLILCTKERAEDLALCQRVRLTGLPVKVLLSLFSCNEDELPAELLQAAHAIVPFDVPTHEFLARLKNLLEPA